MGKIYKWSYINVNISKFHTQGKDQTDLVAICGGWEQRDTSSILSVK